MRVPQTSVVTLLAAALAVTLATTDLAAQPVSFVYRLGADTAAVESFTRTGNRITGEMVQRTGAAVARLSYEMTLGADGRPVSASMKRMQGDGSPVPNAPAEARFRFTADSVVRETVFPDSVQRRAFPAPHALVNFPTFVYGPTELLASMRKAGKPADSIPAIGFAGNVGYSGMVPVSGDTMRLRGGPYAMLLRFDNAGKLQSVDGSNTTNKVMATRVNRAMDVAAMARTMKPTGTLSTRDVARGGFGQGGIVLIDYGRPHVRERSVWGGTLVPFDSVWRTGANDATHLFTSRTLVLGDVTVPPGAYTLWVQHTRNGTFLIVNKGIGMWGTQYNAALDLGRAPMQLSATPSHVEEFTITVKSLAQTRGVIEMAWGPSVASIPFTATVARP